MHQNEDICELDDQQQQQAHYQVPYSNRPRFMNQIMTRHKNRKKTQAKRKTNKLKLEQQMKNYGNNNRNSAYDHDHDHILQQEIQQNLEKKVTYIHGNKIEGTWKNGLLHGNVTIQYQTGQYFSGKYINGVRVYGIVKFKDKTQYQGGFLRDIFHGEGSLTDPSGRVIRCKWQQGEPVQKAKIQYPSGDIYFGELLNLKKHGNGHLFFKNGSKYVGEFYNGAITGYGRYYENDQKVTEGVWKNGVLEVQQSVRQILLQSLRLQKQIRLHSNQDQSHHQRRRPIKSSFVQ